MSQIILGVFKAVMFREELSVKKQAGQHYVCPACYWRKGLAIPFYLAICSRRTVKCAKSDISAQICSVS